MVQFVIKDQGASKFGNYMDTLRGRILQAIREQMFVEMEELAITVAEKFSGNPLHARTGNLQSKILESPKVVQTDGAIRGSVSAQDGALNLGLWLERGHRFPRMRQKLLEMSHKHNILRTLTKQQILDLRTRGGSVKAYPFLIPSLQEREAPILENIRRKVADAIAA